jgi:RNA ligase (TIGR02306 family)
MATLNVLVSEVKSVQHHPNADRLDILTIDAWQCITQRGKFRAGDRAVYFPIDSVLPDDLMARIFSGEGKTATPKGGRIRTIRLRGLVSQGLAVTLEEAGLSLDRPVGSDVTAELGVTKYQPPVKGQPTTVGKAKPRRSRRILHANFLKYTNIEHLQKHSWMLQSIAEQGMDVVAHEKVHGTSARYGWLRKTGWWARLKERLGFAPSYVFLMGSRNVDMTTDYEGPVHNSLPDNVYKQINDLYEMEKRIPKDYQVYGEIIGYGVQPGYHYGLGEGQREFLVYDVRHNDRWLSHWEVDLFCKEYGFRRVPLAYVGPYSLEKIKELALGESLYAPKAQPVREGVVVRPVMETAIHGSRVLFKFVSPDFLLSKAADEEIADTLDEEEETSASSAL